MLIYQGLFRVWAPSRVANCGVHQPETQSYCPPMTSTSVAPAPLESAPVHGTVISGPTATKPRAKRGNGEGSVWHDKKYRRWVGSIIIDGQRYRVTAKTKGEAMQRMKDLRASRRHIGALPQHRLSLPGSTIG
jgi:hypothetical protein